MAPAGVRGPLRCGSVEFGDFGFGFDFVPGGRVHPKRLAQSLGLHSHDPGAVPDAVQKHIPALSGKPSLPTAPGPDQGPEKPVLSLSQM